ncbi:MAG: Tex family protein [Candidatus Coprenecus sp.]|nr:Tex family protein [Candidatus Coprenecus sp.]
MKQLYIDYISNTVGVVAWRVENTLKLLSEGATVPFISRYRKEMTGGLDETMVAQIKVLSEKFNELDQRKTSILDTIASQGKLDESLREKIESCVDSAVLEDLYLPFRPKRRTRASIAREKGLEPLARQISECITNDPSLEARKYLNDSVKSVEEALEGARDIIAEQISEDAVIRDYLRRSYLKYGRIAAKVARSVDSETEQAQKYRNYFDYCEPVSRAASHRVLAILRGADEGVLSLKIDVDNDRMLDEIYRRVLRGKRSPAHQTALQIDYAVEDAFKRLLHPSIENHTIKCAKEKADIESIRVFGDNLRQLLMSAPLGQKRVMAIDPGFRTGCKVVCLDSQGSLVHNDTIYPHPPQNDKIVSMKKISNMVQAYKIEVIAIGNGTAGRETEAFIKRVALPEGVKVYSVSEDGASVYSASDVAREEFPDYDVTVRGAVSIGRRLMDPLAELVKIDPKSIGVGQYQHDVDQTLLKESLDSVVESCVNTVGVNLNTASIQLLSYVSGINAAVASNIVAYRNQNGPFSSRKELLKVKRLGEKVFEQCAGFLRITGAPDPLDNTAVHPERYELVSRIASDCKMTVSGLIADKERIKSLDLGRYTSQDVGMPTLKDIVEELLKPGRDPREGFKVLEFSEDIRTIDDLHAGMELPGIVTNITNFGAFVDFGIKQNGLIHISKMKHTPLKLHQHISVRVLDIDKDRMRIALESVK